MDFDRDFGVNQVFVEDQYERGRQNPAAVDEAWGQYFAQLHGAQVDVQWPVYPSRPPPPGDGNGQTAKVIEPVAGLRAEELQESVAELINAYRIRGHLFANIDPLGL